MMMLCGCVVVWLCGWKAQLARHERNRLGYQNVKFSLAASLLGSIPAISNAFDATLTQVILPLHHHSDHICNAILEVHLMNAYTFSYARSVGGEQPRLSQ